MGDQKYYFDEQDQQERFDQGSIAWDYPCFLLTLVHLIHICMCHLDKDFLELYLYLDSYGILHWVANASAQRNHDLVT